jgi:hypothetical protein
MVIGEDEIGEEALGSTDKPRSDLYKMPPANDTEVPSNEKK